MNRGELVYNSLVKGRLQDEQENNIQHIRVDGTQYIDHSIMYVSFAYFRKSHCSPNVMLIMLKEIVK